jgi:hypothetical protein
MKMSSLSSRLICAAALALGVHGAAKAGVVINIGEVGGDVVTTFYGSLDLTGLTQIPSGFANVDPRLRASNTFYSGVEEGAANLRFWYGFTGPAALGPGTSTFVATSAFGDKFAFNNNLFALSGVFLDLTYASGATLSGGTTFAGQTFALMGLTEGTYVYEAPNDTVTFIIGDVRPGVPEPDSWALLVLGFGLAGSALRARRVPQPALSRIR